jgi:hypothetical protein
MVMTEQISHDDQPSWPWPFTRAQLMAGMRRHFQDTSLQVEEVRPRTLTYRRPGIGVLHGLEVAYQGQAGSGELHLVVKEPHGSTRTGLAGAGRREVGAYQSLASQLPLRTPALICAGASGDWLLLEEIPPAVEASAWSSDDYWTAVKALAKLHDRFWDLGEDLDAYPWLGRPLSADFEVHVTVAAQAIQRIVSVTGAEMPTWDSERMRLLARLMQGAEKVAGPLRSLPSTLLHGDYWPGNIAVLEDGSQAVYDWQLASVGPAVLDLLVFVKKSQWWFGGLPVEVDKLISVYRDELKERAGIEWEDEDWQEQWDHAMIWRFLQEWLDIIAASPEALLKTRATQLDEVWLEPVTQAMLRRLEIT